MRNAGWGCDPPQIFRSRSACDPAQRSHGGRMQAVAVGSAPRGARSTQRPLGVVPLCGTTYRTGSRLPPCLPPYVQRHVKERSASCLNKAVRIVALFTANISFTYGALQIFGWSLEPISGDSVPNGFGELNLELSTLLIAAGIMYIVATWVRLQITVNLRDNHAPL
jgi:hypothetical protein